MDKVSDIEQTHFLNQTKVIHINLTLHVIKIT